MRKFLASLVIVVGCTHDDAAANPNPPAPDSGGGGVEDARADVEADSGTNHPPSYITDVKGGGAMPSWTANVVTASCAGDGVTDDTTCLQAAADAAHAQNRPLVIPHTSSFYKISGSLHISTSVAGVGGMPTIHTTAQGNGTGAILILAPGMTGWIYNLHLLGTFDAGSTSAPTEWDHCINVGSVDGVTIANNLLENPMGDCVSGDITRFDSGNHKAVNVIVDGNTMKNPWRCGVAWSWVQDRWIISNNVIDKQVNYVSGLDFEPEVGGYVTNIEVLYNKFVMDNLVPYDPNRGSDGKAWSDWNLASPSGGNLYLHHNYGSFGTGWETSSNGGTWFNVQASVANVPGDASPAP